jgi:DNA helicase MCM8
MEQQQVSIAKAGVVASLPARCSVIAAANPKHGSYDMSRSVAENLNMAKPILSRFDLVFILRDRVDKVHDRLVSSNIMKLYGGKDLGSANLQTPAVKTVEKRKMSTDIPSRSQESNDRLSISERLAWVSDFQKSPLPADLVRDYIAYSREHCRPQMTHEAAVVLKEYFMELR